MRQSNTGNKIDNAYLIDKIKNVMYHNYNIKLKLLGGGFICFKESYLSILKQVK